MEAFLKDSVVVIKEDDPRKIWLQRVYYAWRPFRLYWSEAPHSKTAEWAAEMDAKIHQYWNNGDISRALCLLDANTLTKISKSFRRVKDHPDRMLPRRVAEELQALITEWHSQTETNKQTNNLMYYEDSP